ncbi:MAG TPA: N-acetyl-gamma-glutamyl-phosphate reductase [Candidatus Rubrimentiphilum sp.]|nr:N-acetyl-gamma-glutamyl-phosphate reductase [Candidatus Rubrimentiphilum sp.]
MTRVHVWGASGYGASEAIAFLCAHPLVELGVLESASLGGQQVGLHFPRLRTLDRSFDFPGAIVSAIESGDVVVMGGAHGSAKELAPKFLEAGARVIDLSDDFRLAPTQAVYGLPERYKAQIAGARFVANPGCYPTATLLAVLPLAQTDNRVTQIIVDAKSGITGAGRKPSVRALYAEVAGDIHAYGLEGHRHEAEIVQELSAAGIDAPLIFTPHVVPLARGMLADAYVVMRSAPDASAVRAAYARFYAGNPFVRLLDDGLSPSVAAVAYTNDAEIAVSVHGNVVRAICAIDNLGKGAATQAVMNMNIMLGFPEESGLTQASASSAVVRQAHHDKVIHDG